MADFHFPSGFLSAPLMSFIALTFCGRHQGAVNKNLVSILGKAFPGLI